MYCETKSSLRLLEITSVFSVIDELKSSFVKFYSSLRNSTKWHHLYKPPLPWFCLREDVANAQDPDSPPDSHVVTDEGMKTIRESVPAAENSTLYLIDYNCLHDNTFTTIYSSKSL